MSHPKIKAMKNVKTVVGEFEITGLIESKLVDPLIAKLNEFAKTHEPSAIHIMINSRGGNVPPARTLRRCLQDLRSQRHVLIGEVTADGWCSSVMLWLLQSFDLRLADQQSRFLFHQLKVINFSGTILQMEQELKVLKNSNEEFSKILTDRCIATGQKHPDRTVLTPSLLAELIAGKDVVWSGRQAKDLGLIDEIVLPRSFR
jgi:ATP-dependent protease ClpP protease subunit